MSADQIALPLDWRQTDANEGRFLVAPSNQAAADHLARWARWPVKASLLAGPPRSGRSLLARNFAQRTGARIIDRAEAADEEMLFHAWNAAQDSGRPLLMIVDQGPPVWQVRLPDLHTRLAVTPMATIEQPDDALFLALLQRHFADRHLALDEDAARMIAARVERTHWNAERIVAAIDHFALAERARLTLPTIRRALISLSQSRGSNAA